MNHQKPSKLKPVLVAGSAMGVALAIPGLNLLNCACCALVIGGGVLATYLYSQNQPPTFQLNYGDGALLGVLAGLVGTFVSTLLSIPIQLVTGQLTASLLPQILEELRSDPNFPPEAVEMLENLASPEGLGAAAIVVGLIFFSFLYAIFGAIGGCLGVAIFQRNAPPAPPVGATGAGSYQPPSPPPPPSTV